MKGNQFTDELSREIYEQTYKYGEETLELTQKRVAEDIASIEEDKEKWTNEFLSILEDFKFVPGGRIISNAGTKIRGTTYINCFVDGFVGKHQDSVSGILEALKRQAFILKSEGGYGFCADVMRPRGGYIEGIANDTPGAVKWLDNWNTQSDVITAGSGRKSGNKKAKQKIRKGAQMVTMSCWHPDIEEFITAKQTSGRLDKFNMSVLVTDDFMDAVMNNKKWDLVFPDFDHAKDTYNENWDGNLKKWIADGNPLKVYKTFKDANELWDLIMKSTYCIDGETILPVYINDEYKLLKIEDIHKLIENGQKIECISLNKKTYNIEKKRILKSYYTGEKETISIKTNHTEFNVTPDHKLFMGGNGILREKLAKNFKVGDNIISVDRIKLNVPNEHGDEIDKDFWEFVGLFVGDGSIRKNHIRFTVNSDQKDDILPLIQRIALRYDKIPSETIDKRSSNFLEISFYSKELYDKLIEMGLGVKDKKIVPEILFNSNIENIKSFISGYLSADGFVSKNENNFKIVYYSKYEKLADDIRRLLLFLGIKSTKKLNYHEEYKAYGYYVSISSYYSSLLKNLISFIVSDKNVDNDKIYNKLYPIRIDRYKKIPYSKNRSVLYKFNKFTELKNLSNQTIEKLKDTELSYDTILEINKIGIKKVYDLTIEDNENFIDSYGGLYHNCRNEPGVLFVDTMNKMNNLAYCEYISATNPCLAGSSMIETELVSLTLKQLHENWNNGIKVPILVRDLKNKKDIYVTPSDVLLTKNKASTIKIILDKTPTGLKQPHEIICTPEHKIFIQSDEDHFMLGHKEPIGYIEAKEIKKGYILQTPYGSYPEVIDIFNNYSEEDVYDIVVPGYNNFYANGYLVHNCGEQILPIGGVCLLGNLNLTQFIKDDLSGWDYDKLAKIIPLAIRFMDNVNDLTYVPLQDQKDNLVNKRRIGLGILGYGSALLIMKKRYGSAEALKLTDELMSFIANTAYQSSALLAKEKGAFLLFDEEKYLKSEYLKNLSDETKALIRKHGIRNSHLLSIQPTGNSSILANVASGGLEPVFLFEYVRTVIQPFAPDGLSIPTSVDWTALTFTQNGNQEWKWIKEGDENMLRTEFEGYVYKFDRGRGILKESVVKDYGVRFLENRGEWDPNAEWAANINNLKIEEHVDTMKVISKYIDSSMSKTINLPNDYKYEDFKHVYIELYKSGTIKGGTTYRAGTMATVIKKKEEEETPAITQENNAPKRPKVLECDVLRFTNKGEKWIGFIGLRNGAPYEIFTGLSESFVVPGWVEKGFIRKEKIKNKDGVLVSRYDFVYNDREGYEVIMTGLNRAFQREYWNIGKMTSALLRHRIHLPSVIEIIESLNLDGDVMGTWKKGMTRMLKKYVKVEDGGIVCESCGSTNLLFKENCISCLDCNWSKCD